MFLIVQGKAVDFQPCLFIFFNLKKCPMLGVETVISFQLAPPPLTISSVLKIHLNRIISLFAVYLLCLAPTSSTQFLLTVPLLELCGFGVN